MTSRPGRLPFSWQKVAIGGHDGSVVTGSMDRIMRKDGMLHYEGMLMPTPEGDEFAGYDEPPAQAPPRLIGFGSRPSSPAAGMPFWYLRPSGGRAPQI